MEETLYRQNPWWEGGEFDSGIERPIYLEKLSRGHTRKPIEVIVGGRRVGKTTILKQVISCLLNKGISARHILCLALDVPALSRATLSALLNQFRKMFVLGRSARLFLLLDEVQESRNWQLELKAIYDHENVKVYCTGSTSSLLQTHGGALTGRHIVTPIFPLSFPEFTAFRKAPLIPSEEYKSEKLVEDYLQTGGYPEHVLHPVEGYMENLIEDVLARDIVRQFHVKKYHLLKDLLTLVAASVGNRISFNRIGHALGLSVDTVKEYIGYCESAFLLKSLPKWSSSPTDRMYASKKLYFIDNGIRTAFTGSGDLGTKAENAVFLHVAGTRSPMGYFAESDREVDFILGLPDEPLAIESRYVSDIDWTDRRLSGLKLFLRRFPRAKKAMLVSKSVTDTGRIGRTAVNVIPLWKLLSQVKCSLKP